MEILVVSEILAMISRGRGQNDPFLDVHVDQKELGVSRVNKLYTALNSV